MGYKLEGTIKELWGFEIFFFIEIELRKCKQTLKIGIKLFAFTFPKIYFITPKFLNCPL